MLEKNPRAAIYTICCLLCNHLLSAVTSDHNITTDNKLYKLWQNAVWYYMA